MRLKIFLSLLFTTLLALQGLGCARPHVEMGPEDLGAFQQEKRLLVVLAHGSESTLWAFERTDNGWEEFLWANGFIGRSGITYEKHEGDGATPAGRFALRRGFSFEYLPKATIPYTAVTETGVWVDDPNSKFYNRWANSLIPDKDWNSAEIMINYPIAYRYGIVIEYNTDPIIKGAGSAIFLHCSTGGPTAGCVSVPEHTMLRLMHFVRPGDTIVIVSSLVELKNSSIDSSTQAD